MKRIVVFLFIIAAAFGVLSSLWNVKLALPSDTGNLRQADRPSGMPSPGRSALSVPPTPVPVIAEAAELAYLRILNATAHHASPIAPPGLEKYFLYDSSAREALVDLSYYLSINRVPLPLFPDIFSLPPGSTPRVFIGILSARRKQSPIWNLVQTVTSMLTRMEYSKNRDRVYIHVFNLDVQPELHSEVGLIEHLVPVTVGLSGVGSVVPDFAPLQIKEALDYVNVLRLLSKRPEVSYPVIVQDDVIVDSHWMELLDQAIALVKQAGADWVAVRLYVAREKELEITKPQVSSYAQGFNSVAVMFNPKHVEAFIAFADRKYSEAVQTKTTAESEMMHIDLVTEAFARTVGVPIKSFEPVVFQHTGIYSSVTQREATERGAALWYMQSKNFNSEGIPITFAQDQWAPTDSEISSR